MQDPQLIDTLFSVAILIFSVVAHEVAHGYAALALGDQTARLAGRLTMNPLKHVDPFGSVILPLISKLTTGFIIGWAKPVPYNPYNLKDQQWGDTKVALAGPFTNIFIATCFGLLMRFGGSALSSEMMTILSMIVQINLLLAVFNLVPIPPLDGSKLLFNALPYKYRYIIDYMERYALFFMVIFIFFLWQFLAPIIEVAYRLIVGW